MIWLPIDKRSWLTSLGAALIKREPEVLLNACVWVLVARRGIGLREACLPAPRNEAHPNILPPMTHTAGSVCSW